jgi:transposase
MARRKLLNPDERQALLGIPDDEESLIRHYNATHKHPKMLAWLSRHPRFVFHFTPTACSWLNAVETFFAALTKRRLRRGVFRSIVDLQTAIKRYIAEHNGEPKPFVWTADPERVLAAIRRGKQAQP